MRSKAETGEDTGARMRKEEGEASPSAGYIGIYYLRIDIDEASRFVDTAFLRRRYFILIFATQRWCTTGESQRLLPDIRLK
jgi:hypothetical protein